MAPPLPDVLMKQVDQYVDSLAPQIQPRITSELEAFQNKTVDVLEDQVIDAFRSLFNKDGSSGRDSSKRSRGLDNSAPGSYGVQSLPFADEIASLTRSFSNLTDEAGDDLRGIFDLTEGGETRSRGGESSDSHRGAKKFLSAAVNAVQDHMDKGSGGQKFELDGILGTISNTVKDASRNPEEKARLITPDIKEQVGAKLREQHAPIAEQFTRIALDHIKRWLRGNTSARDLGDGAKGELEDQVKDIVRGVGGLLGSFKHSSSKEGSSSRDLGDRQRDDGEEGSKGGFSSVISGKLSTGLAKVHREVRLEFRKVLGAIEKQLFELLPDQLQRPLEKVLGGNPFDSQLDGGHGSRGDRGMGDDIKSKLVAKIRSLMRKVQETLRESILGVVNGGHRKFERESWVFVQSMVEKKVQKYLPKVKISVPDDIGNEGVSVGSPKPGAQYEGGAKPSAPSQGGRVSPPSDAHHGGHGSTQQGHRPPSPQKNEGSGYSQQEYNPSSYQQYQGGGGHGPGQQEYSPPSPQRYELDGGGVPDQQGHTPLHQRYEMDGGDVPSQQGYNPTLHQEHQGGGGHSQQGYNPPSHEQYQGGGGYAPAQQGYSPPSHQPYQGGGGHASSQQGYNPPSHEQHHGGGGYAPSQQGYNPPSHQQQQWDGGQAYGQEGQNFSAQGQQQWGSQPDYRR